MVKLHIYYSCHNWAIFQCNLPVPTLETPSVILCCCFLSITLHFFFDCFDMMHFLLIFNSFLFYIYIYNLLLSFCWCSLCFIFCGPNSHEMTVILMNIPDEFKALFSEDKNVCNYFFFQIVFTVLVILPDFL